MKKSKNTKRTLYASVLSTMLCIAMLIGATFAWFTDTASTAVNKIQSGTLDVALVDSEGKSLEGETLKWIKAEGAEGEAVLWEPGCTYKLQPVYVKNNGNLALKFKIVISGIVGDAELLKAIDFTYGELDVNTEGYLPAGETSKAIAIEGHMKEEAGNEYQGKTIEGIAITVYATQDTVENDSYGNQYDKNAEYRTTYVDSEAALSAAIAKATDGDIIKLSQDIVMNNPLSIAKSGIVIDGNGNTLTLTSENEYGITTKNVNRVVMRNLTVVQGGSWASAVTTGVDYENCTFLGGSVYITPKEGIAHTVTGCTFNNGANLQFESYTFSPEISVTGNSFNLNDGACGIALGVGYAKFMDKVEIKDNVFATSGEKAVAFNLISYNDGKAATESDFPKFLDNTFGKGVKVQYNYKDTEISGYVVPEDGIAISGSGKYGLVEDTEISTGKYPNKKPLENLTVQMNGKTLNSTDTVEASGDVTLKNGKWLMEKTFGAIDVRPAGEKATIVIDNVNFVNKYIADPQYGPCTEHTNEALKVNVTDGKAVTIVFTNCMFENACVTLSGYNGGGNVNVTFENCTFNNLGVKDAIDASSAYITGNVTVKNCTFNLTPTGSVNVVDNSRNSVTVTGSGNTVNVLKAGEGIKIDNPSVNWDNIK